MFINNADIAKGSLIYVLEIYFVDYYDGALHYYIIDKLLKLNCHFSRGPLFFHCQVIVRERR